MDDHSPPAPRRQPEGERDGGVRDRRPDQGYTWEGRPGEDFGPIAPPPPDLPPRERRRPSVDPAIEAEPPRAPASAGQPAVDGNGRQPRGVAQPPVRRRRWRSILAALGMLVLLGALAATVLAVISRQAAESGAGHAVTPVAQVSPAAATPSPQALQAPTATGVATAAGAASPAPAASPTPLALAPPTAVPSPTRTPVVVSRASPVLVPALVTPPGGLRFPTSTPARIGTPSPTRTPPPVPTSRIPSFLSRVWSDQILHKVGDQAAICGSASTGASAQVTVITPDRATLTLGEFQPPAERVCYGLRLDKPGLYVLSLIVKDASGTEIDRQSGVLSAG